MASTKHVKPPRTRPSAGAAGLKHPIAGVSERPGSAGSGPPPALPAQDTGIAERPPGGTKPRNIAEGIGQVHGLLEQGDVQGARELLTVLQRRWPNSARIHRFARVIAPPKASVRRGEHTRPLDHEHAWLREHAHEYPGRWLAIYEDELIAADQDLKVVLARVRQLVGEKDVLLHKQPPTGASDGIRHIPGKRPTTSFSSKDEPCAIQS